MSKPIVRSAVMALALLPVSAFAEEASEAAAPVATAPEFISATYSCERAVPVEVTYVNAAEGSIAVLSVENRQIALPNEVSASGARYGSGDDSGSYIWWTKGDSASLMWREAGEETVILDNCTAAAG